MLKIVAFLQYGISIGLILLGTVCSIIHYIALKTHSEWSAPTDVVIIEFLFYLIISVIAFFVLGFIKRKLK
ncbi:MAG: hypothetical protein Q4D16_13490 [Eubacteriales bacterium]|nr:hypothetical protein [Eubacteriales bacterium]